MILFTIFFLVNHQAWALWLRNFQLTSHGRFLLQSAATLADELGVFDEARENSSNTSTHRDSQTENSGSKRRYRLRYLLYVYMNQLGCRVGSLRLIPHILSIPPDAVMRGPDTQFDQGWSNVMLLHVDLTRLARSSSDLLFSSKRVTRGLVLSGDYKRILETFKLSLEQWWEKYSTVPGTLCFCKSSPIRSCLCSKFGIY